jgi:hypothetical protein
LVLQYINDSGQNSLMYDALLAFRDYEGIVQYLLLVNNFRDVTKFVLSIPPVHQRQVFMRFFHAATMELTMFLDLEDKPSMDAIFDTFVMLALTASTLTGELQSNVVENFEAFRKELREPAHFHMYFIFLALMGKFDDIKKFMETPDFKKVDCDFIVSFLVRRGMYALAADVYALVEDRHLLAITYAAKDGVQKLLDLLKGPLAKAKDLRLCWIEALKLCKKNYTDCDWPKLIKQASSSRSVKLDDIFPVVPDVMEMDALHNLVVDAVRASSRAMKESEEKRLKIEKRAEEQRTWVNDHSGKPIEVDPSSVRWFVCEQSG